MMHAARLVKRRAAFVAGIAAGLVACVAAVAFVLRDRPGHERDAVETSQPRELPAPIAAPSKASGPPPVAPVTPRSVTKRRPRPTRAAPPRWKTEPLGDEPPAWGVQ